MENELNLPTGLERVKADAGYEAAYKAITGPPGVGDAEPMRALFVKHGVAWSEVRLTGGLTGGRKNVSTGTTSFVHPSGQ